MVRANVEVEADGIIFRFYFDKYQPELLHLEASGYDIDDAIDIWFDGEPAFWSTSRQTFETLLKNRGIWWRQIDGDEKHILIWSMFTRYR